MSWKPAGYPALSPYLVVPDARAASAFCRTVFGAEPLRHFELPDGTVVHTELRIGDSVLMLADGNDRWPPRPAVLHLYVPDVAAVYERALAAGATSLQEPLRKDDEDRRGGIRDPAGIEWWLATREA